MKYILLAISIFTILTACDDDTKVCDTDVRTELRLRFIYVKDQRERDTTMPKVTLYALGRVNDSIYRKAGISSMQFPLDRTVDSSRFYFQTDTARIADTLIFRYQRQPHFVSAGCGFATYFALDTVISTNNVVKSVTINNKQVTTANEQNITLNF